MEEQKLRKPSEILMKMLAEHAETGNNSIEKIQLSDSIFVEILDENHVLVTNNEIEEEQDEGTIEIVFCAPKKLPKREVFEVNTFEELELRRIKNRIIYKFLWGQGK